MVESYDELVRQITEQVLAALRQRGLVEPGTHASPPPRADVRPPIGVCTGDYSKFPEIAGRTAGQPHLTKHQTGDAIPLTATVGGIVTLRQLQDAMRGSHDGVVHLADDARLTPLAADFVREHPHKVRRGHDAQPTAEPGRVSPPGNPGHALPWAWWIDGRCPAAEQILAQRRGILRALGVNRSPQSTLEVVKRISELVRGRQIAGGLLFVGSAAVAMCIANRCPSLRAVQGSCEQAVVQALDAIGPNVLVIEYPWTRPEAMAAMVDRMTCKRPIAVPHIERQLADLQRGG